MPSETGTTTPDDHALIAILERSLADRLLLPNATANEQRCLVDTLDELIRNIELAAAAGDA